MKKIADVSAPAFEPYLFRTTCDVLNIRSGPGTNYPVIGQIKDKKRYTIVEEQTGPGSAKGWGCLKAGGWVARELHRKPMIVPVVADIAADMESMEGGAH